MGLDAMQQVYTFRPFNKLNHAISGVYHFREDLVKQEISKGAANLITSSQ